MKNLIRVCSNKNVHPRWLGSARSITTVILVLRLLIFNDNCAHSLEAASQSAEEDNSSACQNTRFKSATNPDSMILFEEQFEDTNFSSRGWFDMPSGWAPTLDQVEKAPTGSTRSLRRDFLTGATSPLQGAAMRRIFAPSESFYVRYWVRYSENWVGSGKAWHPHEFHVTTTTDIQAAGHNYPPLAWNHLMTYIEHNVKNGAIIPVLGLQDSRNIDTSRIGVDLQNLTEARAIAGCNGLQQFSPSTSCYQSGGRYYNGILVSANLDDLIVKGRWVKVEVFMQLNTLASNKAQADGIMRYWLNGKMVIDVRSAISRTAQHPEMKFTQYVMAPYIGSGSPTDQTFWVDDLLVATAPPLEQRPAAPNNLRRFD